MREMIARHFVLPVIAALLLCCTSPAAKAESVTRPTIAVDESRATALLAGETLRVHLPLSPSTAQGSSTIIVSLLDAKNDVVASTFLPLLPDARQAEVSLPLPKDRVGKNREGLDWYRVRYQIDQAGGPPTIGILALGEITQNLLRLHLTLSSPRMEPGKVLKVRVFAGNARTRHPFKDVMLAATLTLTEKDGSSSKLTSTAVSNRFGEAQVQFSTPDHLGIAGALTVQGTLRGFDGALASDQVESELEAETSAQIRIQKDKQIYQPGQTVRLRGVTLDPQNRAAAGVPLSLTITDQDNKQVAAASLVTNSFGVMAYDWKMSDQIELGMYTASFKTGTGYPLDVSTDESIKVERYDLPEFTVNATLDRGFYLKDQQPEVRIRAQYLFGKPVAAGIVRLAREEDVEQSLRPRRNDVGEKASLDKDGSAVFHPDVKADFADVPREGRGRRYIDLTYQAFVTDASTGKTEPRKFILRLSAQPIHVYLRLLAGDADGGEYLVTTSYADGQPAACKVTLDGSSKDGNPLRIAIVDTSRYGIGKVHLRIPHSLKTDQYGNEMVHLEARDTKGLIGSFDDSFAFYPDQNPLWITVKKSVLAPGESIQAVLHGPSESRADLDVLGEEGELIHQVVSLHKGIAPITVVADQRFHGEITIIAYSLWTPPVRFQPSVSRTVLYPEDTSLHLRLNRLNKSYQPGTEVQAALRITDAKSGGVPSSIGVAVTDTAIDERARTEADFTEGWRWGSWYGDFEQIGGVTLEDLNRIDITKPIPTDLDLAAEALLTSARNRDLFMQSSEDLETRNIYEAQMDDQLKGLGKAILASHTDRLPSTVGELEKVSREAHIDSTVLLDPWNSPYRVERTTEGNQDNLNLISAGPDKKFATQDDFSILIARQSLFARTGERLESLLKSASTLGDALPGTVDKLFAFAKSHGLDLASLRDANGSKYRYEIRVQGKWLSIVVTLGEDEDIKASGESDSPFQLVAPFRFPQWSSPLMDTFNPTEQKLHAALDAWQSSGHGFPLTEAEARLAFAAAGISFDELRDPTGEPYALRARKLVSYARLQHVDAGKGALVSTTKPVTQTLRAVQVVRQSKGDKNQPSREELVAQFTQPFEQQSGEELRPESVAGRIFRADTGAIEGVVTDQTGAVVPGAVVMVKPDNAADDDHKGEVAVTTGSDGSFVVGDLPPGSYSLKANARGFMSFELNTLYVESAAVNSVNIMLRVGTEMQSVTVAADVTSLQTEASSMAMNDRDATMVHTFRTPSRKPELEFTPRVRHVFEETAYWAPLLETDDTGRVAFHFRLPDGLTTWKFNAVASTRDGRMQTIEQKFITFQPFFVDLDAPAVLTAGDEITLPVNLRNYTKAALRLHAAIQQADWMQLLSPSVLSANTAADGSSKVSFAFKATQVTGTGQVRVDASNHSIGDAVQKTVRVHPDGEPHDLAATALLHDRESRLTLNLPDDAMPGSIKGQLRLYPNIAAHVAESIDRLLEAPHGCGEQTISSSYPSLIYLQLRQSTGDKSPRSAQASRYLQQGYLHLLDYFNSGGAMTYWGAPGERPDAALTAYSMEFLIDAAPFLSVDRGRIAAARHWLLNNQRNDGAWARDLGAPDGRTTLYIALILERSIPADAPSAERDSTRHAVEKALAWAQNSVATAHDAFSNALRLQLSVIHKDPAEQERLVAELLSTLQQDRFGVHWSASGITPFYGASRAGALETTALVVRSLAATQLSVKDHKLADKALEYLIENQDPAGVWLSGHATVQVLKALLPVAASQNQTPHQQNFHLSINEKQFGNGHAAEMQTDAQRIDAPLTVDLSAALNPGPNQLTVTTDEDVQLASTQVSTSFYTPWEPKVHPTVTGKEFGLDFEYQCLASDAKVGQPIPCTVNERRFGAGGYGMLLAEVGLPPGADVDRESLAKLLSEGFVSHYELQPDRIVFYMWSNDAATHTFRFQFTPRFSVHAKAAPATLFDYYNPEERVTLAPQKFLIRP